MKKLFFILLLSSISVSFCYSQFPSPQNFQMRYKYIVLNSTGFCDGDIALGPTYCTSFWWEAPEGDRKPIEYNVYYKENFTDREAYVLFTTQTTNIQLEIGITGTTWVTAVYEDPIGESEPSNIVENLDLPTSIKDIKESDPHLDYDQNSECIIINNNAEIKFLSIINNQGYIINTIENPKNEISIKNYASGLYIIKAEDNNSHINIIKIVK